MQRGQSAIGQKSAFWRVQVKMEKLKKLCLSKFPLLWSVRGISTLRGEEGIGTPPMVKGTETFQMFRYQGIVKGDSTREQYGDSTGGQYSGTRGTE